MQHSLYRVFGKVGRKLKGMKVEPTKVFINIGHKEHRYWGMAIQRGYIIAHPSK